MTLHEYLQSMKGKTAAVIGLGVSNRPLVELLARNGVKVIACDRKERAALGGAAAHYEALGAVLHLGEGYLRDLDADVVFRTPGMRPDVPELLEAKAHGAVITSEMEAFFAVCPCPILGVTGSDGKTTTTSIMAEIGSRKKPSLMTRFWVNCSQVTLKTSYCRRTESAVINSGLPLKK